jgi:hypothetical protein
MAAWTLLASAAVASAQSLVEVARREEERRKAVGTAGKVYTNEQLRSEPGGAPAPAPSPAAGTPAKPSEAAAAPEAASPEPAKPGTEAAGTETPRTEEAWRKRIATEREGATRAKLLADALQSQINGLTTDFENRSDPAQRSVIFANRQKALAELDRVKKEAEQHQKAVATIQEEARRAGIPAGWVR